jgi:serine/threonine protein kinase
MNFADLLGQTLDEKYLIERELGRGGMGTVYLATHVGTERPVAVKVIAPQFMERSEFIERFRREARAAGRLRHPNVVDVTDFGFSDTSEGRVAYLVMEYLDGCTLGEILEEEKSLPLSWTLNILEEVCSAVDEAHKQGIIHRDLKPDNIWVEPNQRGGHTIKVLDFGIAKLEETVAQESGDAAGRFAELQGYSPTRTTFVSRDDSTIAIDRPLTLGGEAATIPFAADNITAVADSATIADHPPSFSESRTAILAPAAESANAENTGTKLISNGDTDRSAERPISTGDLHNDVTTSELTRVGAVLGTPLYMSPEQCRGEKLDARSDIYSLGVIAYQMLSGSTPFRGDFADVMAAHKESVPPPIDAKIRRKVKRVIASTLSKDPARRPQSAEAFASELRSQSEGLWMLLRKALVIFTQQMPKFLGVTTFLSIPVIVLTIMLIALSFLKISGTLSDLTTQLLIGSTSIVWTLVIAFCAYLITGTTTWIVTQHLAMPLRPISVKAALRETKKKWKALAGSGILGTFLTFASGLACAIAFGVATGLISLLIYQFAGGQVRLYGLIVGCLAGLGFFGGLLTANVMFMLVAPVATMEKIRGIKAVKRSVRLVRRSIWTTVGSVCIMFLIPAIISGAISFMVSTTTRAYTNVPGKVEVTSETAPDGSEAKAVKPEEGGISFSLGNNQRLNVTDKKSENEDMRTRLIATVSESLVQIFWLPMHIFISAFTAIIVALLFLKSRQAGGEPMHELLAELRESDGPTKKWQKRVRQRLIQSGRITSKPT